MGLASGLSDQDDAEADRAEAKRFGMAENIRKEISQEQRFWLAWLVSSRWRWIHDRDDAPPKHH